MKRIVFSDIDGTLLDSEHKMTPLTEKAVKKLISEDIPFVIISARSPSGIYPILKEYGFNCPIVSYSGALMLDENRNILFSKGISKAEAKKIIGYIEKSCPDVTWCVYAIDQWIVSDKNDPNVLREESIVRTYAVQGTVDDAESDEINKILCVCDPDKIDRLENDIKGMFPDCSVVKSCGFLLEIMANGVSKGMAAEKMCGFLNVPVENAAAFGDSYNDESMLERVGFGVLMGNAPDELKKRIKRHTLDNDHDGIYHALSEMKWI